MEDFGKYITAAVAVSFVCTVAFLFGEVGVGLHQPQLLPYLTFADFVASSPVTVASLALYLGWSLWNDERQRMRKSYVREKLPEITPLISLILLALWSAATAIFGYFTTWQIGFAIFFVGCAAFQLWVRILPAFLKPGNERLIFWIERGSYVILLAFVSGIFWGNGKLIGRFTVRTEKQVFVSSRVLQLALGVAVLNDHGFIVLPWSEVKLLAYEDQLDEKPPLSGQNGGQIQNPGPKPAPLSKSPP